MGKGSGDQTVTNRPLEELIPFINPTLESLAFQLDQGPGTFAPGGSPLVAGFNPLQNFAFNTLAPGAIAGQQNIGNQIQGGLDFALNQMLNPATNPALQQSANAAVSSVFRGLNEQVIPGIEDQAVFAGGVGGSEQNQAVGKATERATQQALDTTSGMFNQAFQNNLNNFTQTLLGAPGLQQAQLAPLNTALALGGQQQSQSQALIDAQRQEHQFNQGAREAQLSNFLSLLLGNPGFGSQTSPGPQSNPFMSGLGAGLTTFGTTGNPWLALGAGGLGAATA